MIDPSRGAAFWSKVDRSAGPDACWPWTAGRTAFGYGQFYCAHRNRRAHRIAWELGRGAVPTGLHVLHRCDRPACCNPDHLFLGTHADNMADKARKGRAPSTARRLPMTASRRALVARAQHLRGAGLTFRGVAAALSVSVATAHAAVAFTDP